MKIGSKELLTIVLVSVGGAIAHAQPVSFSGKTINVIIGYPPGGGYDTYGRLFASHFGNHVPGKPAVVARNMPGAGSLRLANHLYNAAARDGTDLGIFATSVALEPLFGGQGVQFDPRRFTWIGNMMQDASNIAIWRTSPIQKWEEMRSRETIFGATGPGSISSIHINVASSLLGLKTRVIHGFPGTKEGNLAMERGEIDGYGGLYVSTLRTAYWSNIQNGDIKVVLHLGRSNVPEIGNPPSIFALLNSEEDKQVAGLIFDQDRLGRTVAAPPNIDQTISEALRTAFMNTMRDPSFTEAAQKAGAPINPQTGQEVGKAFESFYNYSPEIIQRAKTLMGR